MALGEKVSPTQKKAYNKLGAEILELPSKRGLVDLDQLLLTRTKTDYQCSG